MAKAGPYSMSKQQEYMWGIAIPKPASVSVPTPDPMQVCLEVVVPLVPELDSLRVLTFVEIY